MAHDITGQAFRYMAAAGIVVVASFPPAFVLVLAGMSIPTVGNVLIPFVAVCKFFLYKYWVFKNNLPRWIEQPTFFIIIASVGYSIFLGLQYGGMFYLDMSEWNAMIIATVIVGTVRFLFFRRLFAT